MMITTRLLSYMRVVFPLARTVLAVTARLLANVTLNLRGLPFLWLYCKRPLSCLGGRFTNCFLLFEKALRDL